MKNEYISFLIVKELYQTSDIGTIVKVFINKRHVLDLPEEFYFFPPFTRFSYEFR